jgi:NitT/TauT family transport system substrate-binding protein
VENMFFYNKFFYKKKLTSLILTALTMILLWGCSREQSNIVVRMAYQGEVEEAPLIIAYEKGFFKKEGVDVELVKEDFEGIKASIENGGIQGATFDYRVFEAVDGGNSIKLVAGLHSGCTQIIVKENSGINSIIDLKGKTIGVTKIGNSSMVVAADLLRDLKIDQSVKWKEGDEESLRKLLHKNEIDAISILEHPDPSKRTLSLSEKILYSSSDKRNKGKSYKHFYESFIGFEGNFIEKNRKVAFNVSIAWLKAAQWVNENQNEAYSFLIDKGYVNDNYESIANKTAFFMWMPGVKYARDHIEIYADVQRSQNILKSGMSEKEFLKKVFEPLIPELNGR